MTTGAVFERDGIVLRSYRGDAVVAEHPMTWQQAMNFADIARAIGGIVGRAA
jgi:hypothetical protein